MPPESNAPARIVRFGTFEADLNARELRKSGVKIKVHGQPFEVLALLLGRPGEVVLRLTTCFLRSSSYFNTRHSSANRCVGQTLTFEVVIMIAVVIEEMVGSD